jgi:hypothetical protein
MITPIFYGQLARKDDVEEPRGNLTDMASKKHTIINRPAARSEHLLIENIGDETVIYDQQTHVAHALKPLAAAVFMYANGESTTAEIAELASYRLQTTVTEAEAAEAVAQLLQLGLVNTEMLPSSKFDLSRRDALKVFGAVGAGTMLISSVAAPFASADLTGNGAPYLCGTTTSPITDASGSSTVSNSSGGAGWPQPYKDLTGDFIAAGSVGGPVSGSTYNLGTPCIVALGSGSSYCSYDGSKISTSDVSSSAQCSAGFFVNSSGSWLINASTTGLVAGTTEACVFSVSSTQYYDTGSIATSDCSSSTGICINSSHVVMSKATSSGSNNHGCGSNTYVPKGNVVGLGTYEQGTWGNGGITGTYEVVPCDGSYVGASYQCSEVVCVPNGVSVTGAVVSGSILKEGENNSGSTGGGYSPYTITACQIWGTNYNGSNFCTNYPYKWCTDNPCVKTGTCKS